MYSITDWKVLNCIVFQKRFIYVLGKGRNI